MKAITIKQPWASLIALGEKKFETRSWQTKHRGQIAIHAGKSFDKKAFETFAEVFKEYGIKTVDELPVGAVIGTVNLIDCHKVINEFLIEASTTGPNIRGREFYFGDYTEGRYAWELSNLQVLAEPVPAKGKLSLWEWDGV